MQQKPKRRRPGVLTYRKLMPEPCQLCERRVCRNQRYVLLGHEVEYVPVFKKKMAHTTCKREADKRMVQK